MADQIYVTVENVQNPAVKRKMTLASARINSKKWRIVSDEVGFEPKKKDVAKSAISRGEEKVVAIIPVTEPIEKTEPIAPMEFAVISEQADEETEEIEKLRIQFEEKAGKPADKRWKKDKLTAKIAEL